jgi:hypothetical protein
MRERSVIHYISVNEMNNAALTHPTEERAAIPASAKAANTSIPPLQMAAFHHEKLIVYFPESHSASSFQ